MKRRQALSRTEEAWDAKEGIMRAGREEKGMAGGGGSREEMTSVLPSGLFARWLGDVSESGRVWIAGQGHARQGDGNQEQRPRTVSGVKGAT